MKACVHCKKEFEQFNVEITCSPKCRMERLDNAQIKHILRSK